MAKRVSMKKVARTYRKNTSKKKTTWDGARRFDNQGQDYAAGTTTGGQNTYKPKARKVTVGGSKRGKGVTRTKTGRA